MPVLRDEEGLAKAQERVEEMLALPIGKFLRLRLAVSREIILSARRRKTSLGAHTMVVRN